MAKKLFIFPFNGNALEALGCIGSDYEFIGFIDDNENKQGVQTNGYTVFNRDILEQYKDAHLHLVPGSSISYLQRKNIIDSFSAFRNPLATLVHHQAYLSPLAALGYNVLIMAGTVVTSNAKIGNHVCILPNSTVHHDVSIGDYTLIGSNVTIAGNVRIGYNCYIGSGTSIIQELKIGDRSLIGIGSTVLSNIDPDYIVGGNPARTLQRK